MIKKKNYLSFGILFLLIILLSEKIGFFRSFYDVFNQKYSERMTKRYDYCSKNGVGYIFDLQNRFDLTSLNPQIKNFRSSPLPEWLFLDTSKKRSKEHQIYLNYDSYVIQKFVKSQKYFVSNTRIYEISKIKKIKFNSPNKFDGFIGKLNIYNKKNNQNILIKKISFDLNDFDNNDLIINFSNKLLAGKRQNSLEPDPGPLLFEIETRNKKISKQLNNISLDIYFDRSDDFKNFEILDNVENCYLLVKND